MARSTRITSPRGRRRSSSRRGHSSGAAAGFTLAESLIASVVLAASVVGIAGTLSASYQQNTVRGNTTTAMNLAQQLMEEIAAKPVELASGLTNKPGWSNGQTDRRQYDTIDDYSGYTDLSGAIQAANGTTLNLSNGGAYQRTVTVTSGAVPSGLTGPSSDFVLVTVTVSMPHNQSTSVSQLFTRVTYYR